MNEPVAKLLAPEKSKILSQFAGAASAPCSAAEHILQESRARRQSGKVAQKGDFAGARSFATGSNTLISHLFSFTGKGKPSLENMRLIDAWQGHLHRQYRSIHVAGTNGKGSVCHKIARALEHEGYRVGLYTSPHLSSFCERIIINGQWIPESAIEALLPPIFNRCKATFFEYTTALAFAYFAQEKVDIAVFEVGLGGRYDATNVISPILSIITSIHYDHTAILGSTLEKIAQEKAGIIKPGVPVVLGPRVPLNILEAIRVPAISGRFYDGENSAIARTALQVLGISEGAIEQGLRSRPAGRFEIVTDRAVLDVAHNPDGIEKLIQAAKFHFPGKKFHYIAAFSRDKDAKECLKILKGSGRVTCVGGENPRLYSPSELASLCQGVGKAKSVQEALQRVSPDEIALVCGSFFIMHEAREALRAL